MCASKVVNLGPAGMAGKSVISIPEWAEQMVREGENRTGNMIGAYVKSPQIYRAVQLRANAVSGVPFVVRTADGELADWPFSQSLPDLLYQLECSMMVFGAGFLLKLRARVGDAKTAGLQWLNPGTVEVARQRDRLVFHQKVNAETYGPWDQDRMVYVREFSFQDEVGPGLAPAKVARGAADMRMSMTEFVNGFFGSGAQPMMLLTLGGNPATAEIERTERFFRRAISGVRNAWRVLATRTDVKVEPITPELRSMAMPDLEKWSLREIAAAFGIPLSVLTSDSANYATAQSDKRLFYEGTVKARLGLYEAAFNSQCLSDIGLSLRFSTESLSMFQADDSQRASTLGLLVKAGLPLREAMLIVGYAVEDVTGGDDTVTTVSTGPAPDANQVNTSGVSARPGEASY